MREIHGDQMLLDNVINVSIGQFYGIEINDFAVTVARTALWIAESQMMKQTEEIIGRDIDFLPLKSYPNITEGNALRIDWESVVPKEKLSYIMGNPPFVGYSLQSKEQKADMLSIYVDEKGKPYKTAGKIDYVAAWYFKAAKLMEHTAVRTAFVSTNSITQGEQVAGVWKPLYDRFGIHIDFAHRTFRWDSEASLKAHVHCVIVGFSSAYNRADKRLFDNGTIKVIDNINAYLVAADDIFIEGFVGKFNDNGELEKMIKYKNKKIIENEINDKDTVKKMLTFRNIIMSKDYFGMLYDIFKDAIEFKNQNMNDVEIFNSELYIDLMDIAASYNQISIFKDIEKHLKE